MKEEEIKKNSLDDWYVYLPWSSTTLKRKNSELANNENMNMINW